MTINLGNSGGDDAELEHKSDEDLLTPEERGEKDFGGKKPHSFAASVSGSGDSRV